MPSPPRPPKRKGAGGERNCQWQVIRNVKKKSTVFRNEEISDDVKPRYKDSEEWPLYKPNNSMLRSKEVGKLESQMKMTFSTP